MRVSELPKQYKSSRRGSQRPAHKLIRMFSKKCVNRLNISLTFLEPLVVFTLEFTDSHNT